MACSDARVALLVRFFLVAMRFLGIVADFISLPRLQQVVEFTVSFAPKNGGTEAECDRRQASGRFGYTPPTDMFFVVAKSILLIVTALFPIVNPIGGSPMFLLMTQEYSPLTRKLLARRVARNSFILLIASVLVGTHILSFFGISLPVVQVGGGLVVISTGWAMLTRSDPAASGDRSHMPPAVNPQDILKKAFYPLTLPLTVGPGSISVAVTLGANEPRPLVTNLVAILSAAIGAVLIAVSIYLCYGYADRLAAAVGPSGMNVILRLSSFLLLCIGVQILWNGASALVKTLQI